MGYRCWWCRGDIPDLVEVWLDADGVPITWQRGVIPRGPAAYHPECGTLFAEHRRARLAKKEEPPAVTAKPREQLKLF